VLATLNLYLAHEVGDDTVEGGALEAEALSGVGNTELPNQMTNKSWQHWVNTWHMKLGMTRWKVEPLYPNPFNELATLLPESWQHWIYTWHMKLGMTRWKVEPL
jgi:hypothetical protein